MNDLTREERDVLQHEILERKTENMLLKLQAYVEVINTTLEVSMCITPPNF